VPNPCAKQKMSHRQSEDVHLNDAQPWLFSGDGHLHVHPEGLLCRMLVGDSHFPDGIIVVPDGVKGSLKMNEAT
jgi:hypothetical protein